MVLSITALKASRDYGKLSGNSLDNLKGGASGRINEADQANKRHPADFLLWKPDDKHIMKWDSPWGVGYPGWHIECSVMAKAKLHKETIDIHTGGEDNIFPHHECEIAQSHGTHGKPFANFWMHARFLQVEGEKMSKSKGNFFTVRDVLEGRVTGNKVDPAVLRYELIKAHYRTNMNFTVKGLEDSAKSVKKLRELKSKLISQGGNPNIEIDHSLPTLNEFMTALADDLNIAGALGIVFSWVNGEHPNPDESLSILMGIDQVLAVIEPVLTDDDSSDKHDIDGMCKAIDQARADKDYGKADELRKELAELGYVVSNSPEGTIAEMKLA